MNRHWLLTWTTYGTWLIGDGRGFVGNIAGPTGAGTRFNEYGTAAVRDLPRLHRYMQDRLISDPVFLTKEQAGPLIVQFRETAAYRGWCLPAAAIMANHIHLVVAVPDDPDPDDLMRDFKAYASRRLNRQFGRRERWWTEGGSTRVRKDWRGVRATIRYVRMQKFPLVIFVDGERPA